MLFWLSLFQSTKSGDDVWKICCEDLRPWRLPYNRMSPARVRLRQGFIASYLPSRYKVWRDRPPLAMGPGWAEREVEPRAPEAVARGPLRRREYCGACVDFGPNWLLVVLGIRGVVVFVRGVGWWMLVFVGRDDRNNGVGMISSGCSFVLFQSQLHQPSGTNGTYKWGRAEKPTFTGG